MIDLELYAWTSFVDIVKIFLDNHLRKLQGVCGKAIEKSTGQRH